MIDLGLSTGMAKKPCCKIIVPPSTGTEYKDLNTFFTFAGAHHFSLGTPAIPYGTYGKEEYLAVGHSKFELDPTVKTMDYARFIDELKDACRTAPRRGEEEREEEKGKTEEKREGKEEEKREGKEEITEEEGKEEEGTEEITEEEGGVRGTVGSPWRKNGPARKHHAAVSSHRDFITLCTFTRLTGIPSRSDECPTHFCRLTIFLTGLFFLLDYVSHKRIRINTSSVMGREIKVVSCSLFQK